MSLSISEERKAERILLKRLIDMPQKDRIPYLQSLGISRQEFEELWDKYSHLIEEYMKYKEEHLDAKDR